MRHVLGLFILALLFAFPASAQDHGPFHPASVDVFFSPIGGATEACVAAIAAAKKTINVQAYSWTSAPIATALMAAKKRGVVIEVILDKSQRTEKYSEADFVAHAGIPTYIDTRHAIAHNKIIIIGRAVVLTGSFNFTKAAEQNNAENLLVIHDPKMATRYLANWEEHKVYSDNYAGR